MLLARTGPPCVITRTTSKAWKERIRLVVATNAAVGRRRGHTTSVKVATGPAPSSAARSSTERGQHAAAELTGRAGRGVVGEAHGLGRGEQVPRKKAAVARQDQRVDEEQPEHERGRREQRGRVPGFRGAEHGGVGGGAAGLTG